MAVASAEILDAIANMTVIELSHLIKEMEDKFGVSAAAATVAAAPAAAGAAPAAVEEKTEFTVMLDGLTDATKKIGVIKVVREITACGLADGKVLVESAPKAVKENVSKEEAETIKKKLEEAGAKVSLK